MAVTRKQRRGATMHMKSGSAKELRAMRSMVRSGPVTIMLVFSTTCPHCTTYMPIWKKLCGTQGRKANMISMEASTYNKTPMAVQKPVSGVPTVLYVDKEGTITEAGEPRNTTVMTNAVKMTSGSDLPTSVLTNVSNSMNLSNSNSSNLSNSMNLSNSNSSNLSNSMNLSNSNSSNLSNSNSSTLNVSSSAITASDFDTSNSTNKSNTAVYGTNPLSPLPASVVPSSEPKTQSGGSPWAAFLLAARQAAPAAVLLGAYAALPMKRSSGLSDPIRRSRKTRRKSNRNN